ncbi:MAG: hypothetical protein GY803_13230, partial [Chloroflexi bacterium]|nr:hypothetical protein [Chloroflexota bacterium]
AIDRTAYATTAAGELYRSRDGGRSWTIVGAAPERPSFQDVVVNRVGVAFVASDSGVWQYATPAEDILINGRFENNGGWEMSVTPQTAVYSDEVVYAGRQSARIGGVNAANKYAYSSARQTVALPANTIEATLTFQAYFVSGEAIEANQIQALLPDGFEGGTAVAGTTAVAVGDAQYALILDPNSGDILETLLWELENGQTWQTYSFDLIHYAGQEIMLHFGAYNDGLDGQTGLYLDDAALVIRQTDIWANQVFLPVIIK